MAALIIAAASCQKEELKSVNPNPETPGGLVFTATLENADATKTTIGKIEGGYKVKWESTDSISVNGVIYKAQPDATYPAQATFTKMREGDPDPKAPYTVYYPASVYDSTAKKAVLPKTQIFKAEGNIAGILPMYAEGSDLTLQFKNLCGLLKFNLKGTETVRHITVSDTSKALCGEFNVTDNAAVLTTDTGRILSLDCGEGGVTLDASTGHDFYVALPAGNYEHLAIEYTTTGGANVCRMKANTTATIERNKVYAFDQTPVFSAADYLCFTCTGGNVAIGMTKKNSKTMNAPDISLLYYTDRTGWQDFKIGVGNGSDSTSIALTSGEKVYFRAKASNDSLAASSSAYNYFTTTATDNGKVDVSGNIMTLLDGDNPGTTLAHANTFTYLFKNCTSIQNASGLSLPATSLASYCYSNMFNGCTALTTAPALPATSLAMHCYFRMFKGCTSLETAPTLPATTMAGSCYSGMFFGCTGLTQAPALSATTLASSCYDGMFTGCTSLTEAPVLNVTELKSTCYNCMFQGCTALTTAPALPATTLETYCYAQMFQNCSKLTSVTMLATDVQAKGCLNSWLDNAGTDESVTSRTVYIAKGMGSEGLQIPTSWTKVEILPGVFSVSADKKVRFSKGNLYWNGSVWHLETNQYDCPPSTDDEWDENHVGHLFWTKTAAASYAASYSDGTCTASDKFFCDGSDAAHTLTVDGQGGLYALSKDEWIYLINTRTNASTLMKKGVKVAEISNCMIIAPDGYTGTIAASYDYAAWSVAESQGLVCLPAAGCRSGSYVDDVGYRGYYWSSTLYNKGYASALYFDDSNLWDGEYTLDNGYSVRLVYSAQ